jgi:hypothetical protein
MSTAQGAPEQHELEALMLRARANNERDGITGLVAYHDSAFIQVLEGPEDEIVACFERIKRNDLHHNIMKVLQGAAEERIFDRYNMAFMPTKDQVKPANSAFIELSSVFEGDMGARLKRDPTSDGFLRTFYDSVVTHAPA